MATNPMQRKARNSFLLGMLLMLVILGAVIAVLVLQLMNKMQEEKQERLEMVSVYVLKSDVKSGQVITSDMLVKENVYKKFVPANATSNMDIIETWKMQDKEGNEIYIKTNEKEDNGIYKLYIRRNGSEYEVKQEEETEQYYIEVRNNKEYIELNSVPLVAKVDLNANTVLTEDLITRADNLVQDDIRKQEYNIVVLPVDITTGDYVDIRVMFPNGQDFIVVSKKEVEIPNVAGMDSIDTIWANLSEDEILHMSCAIIEAAKIPGSKIYANKYTDPGMQKAATPTYVVNSETLTQLRNDPNILEKSMEEIVNRYGGEANVTIRNNINGQLNNENIDTQSNLQTKMEESVTNSKNTRKEYVESLATPTTGTTAQ